MLPVFEALTDLMQSFSDDDPKPSLHVGEVMNSWLYLTLLGEMTAIYGIFLNTTTHPELRDFIEKAKEGALSQHKRLTDFMQKEGVPLPPESEPKPLSQPEAVPMGAKFTDNEIANSVSIKLTTAMVTCATTASEAVRNDVGVMFIKFQAESMVYGIMIKTLLKKNGWIKIPPYYNPPGVPKRQ